MSLDFFHRTCVKDFKEHGWSVPSRRSTESELTAGLEALDGGRFGIAHLLNMVWQPILKHLDQLAAGDRPPGQGRSNATNRPSSSR